MNMICTRFASVKSPKPIKQVSLIEVLNEIRSDKYRDKVEAVRAEELPSKSPLKDKLPVFTPTGQFNYRSIAGLENYNGIVCLDIDNIELPEDLKSKCKNLPYVYSAFITPSGQGLKVLIKTDSTKEQYKDTEIKIAEMFLNDTGAVRDNHCKDIARIQFVSYDPSIYINEKSQVLCMN